MLSRRQTLQTILYLADELAKINVAIDLVNFRGCTYSGFLQNGEPWNIPDRLKQNRAHWSIYQRNELLSIAVQGLFFVLLDVYQESGLKFASVEELCQWFLTTPELIGIGEIFELEGKVGGYNFSEFILVAGNWTMALRKSRSSSGKCCFRICYGSQSEKNRSQIIQSSLRILVALLARTEINKGYNDIIFPSNYLQFYPINLNSLVYQSEETWNNFTVKEWVYWLCSQWGVNTHLKIALRKLRNQSQSTSRIRPSDRGLEVTSVPEAVYTSPRFHQSFRILKDLGVLIEQDKYWRTSDLGGRLKELSDE